MKKYTVKLQEIIDLFNDDRDIKIEVYSDSTADIYPAYAYGYPEDRVDTQFLYRDDFLEFDGDIKAYRDWLNNNFYSASDDSNYIIEFI